MPCDMLAVQMAEVQINEKVLTVLFGDALARNALTALIQDKTDVALTAYAYSGDRALNLYGGGIDILIRADGSITVRARTDAETQRYAAVIKDALSAVASVVVQNMVKTALVSAGVPVVADAYNAAGARVMTLRV